MEGKKKTISEKKRVKPELPGGFKDARPEMMIAKNEILKTIRKTFENFGFDPMDTSSVERTEVLLGGEEESSKIIFNIRGSEEEESKNSLRFDLTVPLARFLAANPDIPKPFKRYQIGNAWRGESPQAGRYREFMQADIDTVGSSSPTADAEIIAVICQTLQNLGVKNFLIKINNRRILNGLPEIVGFPEEKLSEMLRIIDKKDKIGLEGIKKEVSGKFGEKIAERLTAWLKSPVFPKENREADEGQKELNEVLNNLRVLGIDEKKYETDFTVIRGLGYYTGTVFETVIPEAKELGSIFSGGRYDNLLIPFMGQKIPAVGVSLGVDRLMAVLEKLGRLKKKATTTQVLILRLDSALQEKYLSLAAELRKNNLNTSLYLGEDSSFQGQLTYAVKKEIPYVVILGAAEKEKGVVAIKNLQTREQTEVARDKIVEYFDNKKNNK